MTDDKEVIRQMKVPIAGVTDDGKIHGTITKKMREDVDFDQLMEDTDEVRGYATIEFRKEDNQDNVEGDS